MGSALIEILNASLLSTFRTSNESRSCLPCNRLFIEDIIGVAHTGSFFFEKSKSLLLEGFYSNNLPPSKDVACPLFYCNEFWKRPLLVIKGEAQTGAKLLLSMKAAAYFAESILIWGSAGFFVCLGVTKL